MLVVFPQHIVSCIIFQTLLSAWWPVPRKKHCVTLPLNAFMCRYLKVWGCENSRLFCFLRVWVCCVSSDNIKMWCLAFGKIKWKVRAFPYQSIWRKWQHTLHVPSCEMLESLNRRNLKKFHVNTIETACNNISLNLSFKQSNGSCLLHSEGTDEETPGWLTSNKVHGSPLHQF